MQLISKQLGKFVLMVNIDEILPEGGTNAANAIPLVAERYGFVSAPSLEDSIAKAREQGFPFKVGRFTRKDGQERDIQEFVVWNNGLVVSAYTTDDAEAFLEDFFTWGGESLGLRMNPTMWRTHAYLSEVIVKFDLSVNNLLKRFEAASNTIKEALTNSYKQEFPRVELSTIEFDFDKSIALNAISGLTGFFISRRLNHPYSDETYFTQAPLPTQEHIRVLEQLEILLKG